MSRIHHNTVKRAARFGLTINFEPENEGFVVVDGEGRQLARHDDPKVALETAIGQVDPSAKRSKANGKAKPQKAKSKKKARKPRDEDEEGDEDFEGDDEGEGADEEETKSVVKPKYRKRYRPFKLTCGDDLAGLITKHVKVKGADGETRVDEAKLRRFAQANDCWKSEYSHLNVGMRRMNVANRLRAKVRKGYEVKWAG